MLNEHERRTLCEVERHIAAADPTFAASLRDGQQHLKPAAGHARYPTFVGLLAVLAVVVLMLGSSSGLALASLAVVMWRLRGYRITLKG
jgi:hypothetical protein